MAAKFRSFDLRFSGQHDARGSESRLHPHADVGSPAHGLIFGGAAIDLDDGQRFPLGDFVFAGNRLDREHLGHEDAVDRTLNNLKTFHFRSRQGEPVGDGFGVQAGKVDEIGNPIE